MLSPSPIRAAAAVHPGFLLPLEAIPDIEGKLGAMVAGSDRASVGADDAALALQDEEVLADRDRGDAETPGEIGHSGPPVLLHDPRDLLLTLAREDAIGHVCGPRGHGISLWLGNLVGGPSSVGCVCAHFASKQCRMSSRSQP
jgi:hypothetical protein